MRYVLLGIADMFTWRDTLEHVSACDAVDPIIGDGGGNDWAT